MECFGLGEGSKVSPSQRAKAPRFEESPLAHGVSASRRGAFAKAVGDSRVQEYSQEIVSSLMSPNSSHKGTVRERRTWFPPRPAMPPTSIGAASEEEIRQGTS